MTTCRDCGATWTGKRIEHCTVCHQTFTGTKAGDKHRTGTYVPLARRCLTADEMRAKGMAQNQRGQWVSEQGPWRQDGVQTPAPRPAHAPGAPRPSAVVPHDPETAQEATA
jgi:hypothetical protein